MTTPNQSNKLMRDHKQYLNSYIEVLKKFMRGIEDDVHRHQRHFEYEELELTFSKIGDCINVCQRAQNFLHTVAQSYIRRNTPPQNYYALQYDEPNGR